MDTPVTRPKFLTRALTLPAIPSLFLGAVDITSELFGDWNKPFPMDRIPMKMAIVPIDVNSFIVAIKNNPVMVNNNPRKVKNSEPILSDRCPLIGATMDSTIGYIIITNPVVDGLSFNTS
jgi:hypothetical protein